MVSFDEWKNLDIRVGKIEEVNEIEGKDKLYKMTVSFGEKENGEIERRSVVAGLKLYLSVSDLLNKKAAFVYNLDPVKLAGIESQAMILAAKNNEGAYRVFFADESVKEGTRLE